MSNENFTPPDLAEHLDGLLGAFDRQRRRVSAPLA